MLRMKTGEICRQNKIDENAVLFIVNRKSFSQAGRRGFEQNDPHAATADHIERLGSRELRPSRSSHRRNGRPRYEPMSEAIFDPLDSQSHQRVRGYQQRVLGPVPKPFTYNRRFDIDVAGEGHSFTCVPKGDGFGEVGKMIQPTLP